MSADAVIPADAALLREIAGDCVAEAAEATKARDIEYFRMCAARLRALADVLDRATPAPRYACGYCGTAHTGSVTPQEGCARPVDVEHDGRVTHTTCGCPLVLCPPPVDRAHTRGRP